MPDESPKPFDSFIESRLVTISSLILCLLGLLLTVSLGLQWTQYGKAISFALDKATLDHAAALAYSRALDVAVTKTSALILAFSLVFLGAMYVLRSGTTTFELALKGKSVSGTLASTSPGLIMVTLGLLIVTVVLLTRSDITYQSPSVVRPAPARTGLIPAEPTLEMER